MPEAKLRELLAGNEGREEPVGGGRPDPIAPLLDHVKNHRRRELVAALLADAATMGPLSFLEERMAPLTDAVGNAWACGAAAVHHEHFFTECAEDVIRAVRLPFEREARGPGVIFATLPGELHGLGLQMATLAAAAAGLRPHVLGTATPVQEIADAWVVRNADAIGISISLSTGGPSARRQLARLRETIPMTVPILLGGRGARRAHPSPDFAIVEDLRQIADVARTLRARAS
jgi:methanogenic corrinoid protein MtbC1